MILHRIKQVRPINPHCLALTFSNGEVRQVDASSLVERKGQIYKGLKNWDVFSQVAVRADDGAIEWPTGLDLDPNELYEVSAPVES